jgi:ATP-dependent Clp protease ATP-binding subunit ClpX
MIEGGVMEVPENSYRIHGAGVMIDTSNILFVCGGAFEGIKNKASNNNPIGFCKEFKTIENNDKPTAEDFVKYGFIRELIGRLPAIVGVEALTIQDLIDILEKAEGSILKKYVTVFDKLYNVKLEFTKEAIVEIAKQAYNKGTGARGLNSIVGDLVQELMYEAPSNPVITGCCITAEVVKKIAEPQIIYYEDER